MAGLPSVMQAKKLKMVDDVVIPPLEGSHAPKPVPVNKVVTPIKATNGDAEKLTADEISAFEVRDDASAPAAAPVASPTPSPSPSPTQVNAPDWKEVARVHEERWKSLQGINEKEVSENKDLRARLIAQDERIASLETQIKKPSAMQAVQEDPLADLTPEEKEAYSGSIGVIDKLANYRFKQNINQVVDPLMKKIEELEKNNNTVVTRFQATDENVFAQRVQSEVKDVDKLISLPQWQDYHKRRISPYTEETIGDALKASHNRRDLNTVTQIFKDFVQELGVSGDGGAYSSVSVVPNGGTNAQDFKPKQKPMLKGSERKKISEQFRKRQISQEKYNEAIAIYKEADAEGRIDWSK